MTPQPEAEDVDEGMAPPQNEPEEQEQEGEGGTLPLDLVGEDVQPGDTISLTVVSVDAEAGTATVAKPEEPEEPQDTAEMAGKFRG